VPLITVAAIGFLALLVFCLVKWLTDDVYALNDSGSLIYMGALYVLALAIYVGSRVLRKRQGIDMGMVHKEIPAE
jgi:basic amino acid/polyamine antiporter, APA family